MRNLNRTIILAIAVLLAGCETGLKNKTTKSTMNGQASTSGIVSDKEVAMSYKSSGIKSGSEIKKIFSKSAVPGYYLQVGHFRNDKPSSDFINKMKSSKLPYTIMEKFEDGTNNYYALIGPYRSYNEAKRVEKGGKTDSISHGAFVINVLRP